MPEYPRGSVPIQAMRTRDQSRAQNGPPKFRGKAALLDSRIFSTTQQMPSWCGARKVVINEIKGVKALPLRLLCDRSRLSTVFQFDQLDGNTPAWQRDPIDDLEIVYT